MQAIKQGFLSCAGMVTMTLSYHAESGGESSVSYILRIIDSIIISYTVLFYIETSLLALMIHALYLVGAVLQVVQGGLAAAATALLPARTRLALLHCLQPAPGPLPKLRLSRMDNIMAAVKKQQFR